MVGGGLAFLGFCLIAGAFIIMSVRIYQVKPVFVVKILKYMLIGFIALLFSAIAVAIGFRVSDRHESSYSRSLKSVAEIWGGHINIASPSFTHLIESEVEYQDKETGQTRTQRRIIPVDMGFEAQNVNINVQPNIRSKGLLIFPGYMLNFKGVYEVKNFRTERKNFYFKFILPELAGTVSNITALIDEKPYSGDSNYADGIDWSGVLSPGESRKITITFSAKGMGGISYSLGQRKVEIKKLRVNLETGFEDITIPDGSMVPTKTATDASISKYEWDSEKLVTGQNISLNFEIPGNYGKLVSKLFFYAPVAIFLFLGFLVIFCVARGLQLHPMNYLFIITGFFIFYLLNSYLVSFMHVIVSTIISLAASSGLMLYYCVLIKKEKFLLYAVAGGSALFQWVFSVAFFFPEYTGLTITLAGIAAFVGLMKASASIDWANRW